MDDLKRLDCKRGNYDVLGGIMGVIGSVGIILLAHSCSREPMPAVTPLKSHASVPPTIEQVKLTEYFRRAGSRSPQEMAYAVIHATPRNTKLLASISVVESGGNSGIRNGGYRHRHHGAYQVNPKYHGAVPHDAIGQALQAEKILEELTQTMPIKKALSQYGGDSTGKYSRRVLAELSKVP